MNNMIKSPKPSHSPAAPENGSIELPRVSVLFITYKRFEMVKQALLSFRENTDYPNLELIIADDGSGPEIQAKIRTLPADFFALSPKNRGLGANNNNAIDHSSGKYILMLQDDWNCHGPRNYLREAVSVMELNPDIGLINFAGARHPPDLNMRLSGSHEPCYVTPVPCMSRDGMRELSLYTDQPHLQSMECVKFLGPYRELPMVRSESFYEQAWKDQKKYKAAVFPNWQEKVFQCDYEAESYSAAMFSRRAMVALLPIAQWLKLNLKPVYKVGRAGFYGSIRILESLRIVK